MEIIYKTGNLLACEEPILAHSCNAQGVMGSGVAKVLRDADENIFTEYRRAYEEQGDRLELGQTIWVASNTLAKVVINLIGQEFYGRDPSRVYVSYDAIRKGFREINSKLSETPHPTSVAMPLLGAGLANGDWKIISQIIEEESTNFQPVVYLLEGFIPG